MYKSTELNTCRNKTEKYERRDDSLSHSVSPHHSLKLRSVWRIKNCNFFTDERWTAIAMFIILFHSNFNEFNFYLDSHVRRTIYLGSQRCGWIILMTSGVCGSEKVVNWLPPKFDQPNWNQHCLLFSFCLNHFSLKTIFPLTIFQPHS